MRKITMTTALTAVPKDEEWSVIQLLTLENISGSVSHMRMCMVYGGQNIIPKSIVNQWVHRFKVGQISTSDEPSTIHRWTAETDKKLSVKISSLPDSKLTGLQKKKKKTRKDLTRIQLLLSNSKNN